MSTAKEVAMNFRPELSWESLPAEEITAKTVRALRNHIRHVKECSGYYRREFASINPDDIQSLEQFSELPLTDRSTLAGQSSHFLGTEPRNVVETVLTTGATGRALPFVYTASDLERIAFSYALSLHSTGMNAADRVLLPVGLDRCTLDGMALYRGAQMTQANVLRGSIGMKSPASIHTCLAFFKPTVLVGPASILKSIAEESVKNGHDCAKSAVKKIIATTEAVFSRECTLNAVGTELSRLWGAEVFSLYGTTELAVSYCTTACESGAHAHPELVYTEIVDDTGKCLPDGVIGELVATPLGVEGVPLVRYRTGDLTFKVPGTCTCGRNSVRIGPIIGRKGTLLSCGGVKFQPQVLAAALDSVPGVKDHLTILERDGGGRESITIQIAAAPAMLEKAVQAVKAATGVHIPILISNVPTIAAMRGSVNAGRSILDKRGNGTAAG